MNEYNEDIIRALLGHAAGFVPEATADSIFTALAPPELPFHFEDLETPEGRPSARFNERSRQIDLDWGVFQDALTLERDLARSQGQPITTPEAVARSQSPSVIAHELFHQESVTPDRQLRANDPQIQGLVNMLENRIDEATPEERKNLYARYYKYEPADPEKPLEGTPKLEVMAQVVQDAFEIARAADPSDPSAISDMINESDAMLPGIREAVNFFIRRFPSPQEPR